MFIEIIPIYKEGGGPLLGTMTFGNSKYTHKTLDFVYMYNKPQYNLVSYHQQKDTENQHRDSVIPCINNFIGNQDKKGHVICW